VKVSDEAVNFIKQWEGFSPFSYWDVSRWSIGYGTEAYEGEALSGAIPAEEIATQRLKEALVGYAAGLSNGLSFEPTENESIALLSAAFNLGVGSLKYEIIKFCNEGQFKKAADALRGYDHANGVVLPSLTARREAEARLLEADMRGTPRTEYARTVHLLEQRASIDEWVAVAREAYEARSSVTASYDDAGIGDLDDRTVILHGKHDGAEEWFQEHYPGVVVLRGVSAPNGHQDPSVAHKRALCGLHGSADSCWGHDSSAVPIILDLVRDAKIEAFKALSGESPKTADLLREINPAMFICVRAMWKPPDDTGASGGVVSSFLDDTLEDCKRWAEKGITHFEIHNEPNLFDEGFSQYWHDGREFGEFFIEVARVFREEIPGVQIGWPGLSPGENQAGVRTNAVRFFREAEMGGAINAADWIGAHCYFRNDAERVGEGGQYYRHYLSGDKDILITEYSNPSDQVDRAAKAQSYINYLAEVGPRVHSMYSFIAAASSGFPSEIWTRGMARIIGSRPTINGTSN
jgi:GH24 family phage-related lysozyme (muramidase)